MQRRKSPPWPCRSRHSLCQRRQLRRPTSVTPLSDCKLWLGTLIAADAPCPPNAKAATANPDATARLRSIVFSVICRETFTCPPSRFMTGTDRNVANACKFLRRAPQRDHLAIPKKRRRHRAIGSEIRVLLAGHALAVTKVLPNRKHDCNRRRTEQAAGNRTRDEQPRI
jgi:hypothetical protein